MSESITCPGCGAANPLAAAFCTACGASLAAAPMAPAAPADATKVEAPGLHDATAVHDAPAGSQRPASFGPPPSFDPVAPVPQPPTSAAGPPPPPPSTPWAPPSGASPTGAASTAPWNPPASPPPPTWQQPTPPPGSATFGAASTAAAQHPDQPWAAQASHAPSTMWGASTAPATATQAKKGSVLGGIAALLGAVLAVAGVFSGWVAIDDGTASSSISGWTLTTGDGVLKSNDPYLVLGLGVASLVLSLLLFAGVARVIVRIATVLAGIGITAVAALNWASIASYVTDNLPSTFEATTDVGFFLAIAGGVLVAVGGLAPARR